MQVAIEDEQALSRYLSHARAGEDVVLTEYGRVVGRIVAATSVQESREEAIAEIRKLMQTGVPLGGPPFKREELYERD